MTAEADARGEKSDPLSEWLTTEEVAAMSGIEPMSIRRYAWRGAIPAPVRKGRTLLWNRAEIEEWLPERRGPGRPAKATTSGDDRSTEPPQAVADGADSRRVTASSRSDYSKDNDVRSGTVNGRTGRSSRE